MRNEGRRMKCVREKDEVKVVRDMMVCEVCEIRDEDKHRGIVTHMG